jgi:hypothetical protein
MKTCQNCGYIDLNSNCLNVKLYKRYRAELCDRCVDNFDGVTPWSASLESKYSLPKFKNKILKNERGCQD